MDPFYQIDYIISYLPDIMITNLHLDLCGDDDEVQYHGNLITSDRVSPRLWSRVITIERVNAMDILHHCTGSKYK